ncbi:MAG: protoporphyrinogen oxidase HemJ [Gammaproteobacteria bacterium]|nr:protoporphyrinogen oxidase HemJ [Gammaproteobacteria bacterium]MCY4226315.1 protoporphyrinogen oxidase HemJ [Gammaproteobacteria bacterium]
MLWIKSFHIIAMVTWFAGLFYLPRLYVYHAQSTDLASIKRFKIMERKLFYGIMTPGAVLTLVLGAWLWLGYGFSGGWLHAKLAMTVLVVIHHIWCYRALVRFRDDANQRSHVFYRWMNEVPVLYLVIIVILVVVKPF